MQRFVQEIWENLKEKNEKEELFLQLLEAAIKTSNFLRMEDLTSEKDQLDEVPEDGDENNQLTEIEKNLQVMKVLLKMKARTMNILIEHVKNWYIHKNKLYIYRKNLWVS